MNTEIFYFYSPPVDKTNQMDQDEGFQSEPEIILIGNNSSIQDEENVSDETVMVRRENDENEVPSGTNGSKVEEEVRKTLYV